MPVKKVTQNMQDQLSEIGQRSVLLRLAMMSMGTPWEVFLNVGEAGYDILLTNTRSKQRVKIEVKTRQRLHTTAKEKNKNTAHFTVTKNERTRADFVVCYWWEKSWFFVVPSDDLRQTGSGKGIAYKFIVSCTKRKGTPSSRGLPYWNRWDHLAPHFEKTIGVC